MTSITLARTGGIALLCIILIIAPAGTFFAGQGEEKEGNDYFASDRNNSLLELVERYHLSDNFWTLFRQKEYYYAVGDIKYILRYYPNHPLALSLLCTLAQLLEDPGMPLRYFANAITLYPNYAITRIQYGEYLVSISLYENAVEQLKTAISLNPKSGDAYASLSAAYAKSGQKELADAAMEKAKKLGYKEIK